MDVPGQNQPEKTNKCLSSQVQKPQLSCCRHNSSAESRVFSWLMFYFVFLKCPCFSSRQDINAEISFHLPEKRQRVKASLLISIRGTALMALKEANLNSLLKKKQTFHRV